MSLQNNHMECGEKREMRDEREREGSWIRVVTYSWEIGEVDCIALDCNKFGDI